MQQFSPDPSDQSWAEQAEGLLLRFLCQPEATEAAGDNVASRQLVLDALRGHRFATTSHQVLFDCVKDVPASRAALLESLLPARLVRAGFPDFDWTPYLRPSELSAAEADTLCRRLREISA